MHIMTIYCIHRNINNTISYVISIYLPICHSLTDLQTTLSRADRTLKTPQSHKHSQRHRTMETQRQRQVLQQIGTNTQTDIGMQMVKRHKNRHTEKNTRVSWSA